MTSRRKRPSDLTESDFANEKMGHNKMQGDDQRNVPRQRHAVPGVKTKADADPNETMEKTDKNVRARRDLGKGRGVHPENSKAESDGK
jgi:hypothetical protein